MNWWNRNKKTTLIVLGGLFILTVIAILFLMISGPIIGGRMCTLVGCIGGLEIKLIGLPNGAPYEIKVEFPSGETQSLICGTEEDQSEAFVKSCLPHGAFFSLASDVEPPKEITATVTVNGKQTSEVFRPDYIKFQPNGEDCPPVCHSATVTLKLAP